MLSKSIGTKCRNTKQIMKYHRRYKYPPVEEALCEFRFVPDSNWDLTIPGKLQTELGKAYSGKSREQRAIEFGLQVADGRLSNIRHDNGLLRVQLITEDGKRIVGVGSNVISTHVLRPYQNPDNLETSGWDEFLPRISKALQAYEKVADAKSVIRVGVRYINKIVIPETSVKIEEYLNCVNLELEGLPENYANFFSQVDYVYEDNVLLKLSYGLLNASSTGVDCLLDLDAAWQAETSIDCEESINVASDLHERVSEAFESVITDKARELFDVVSQ